MTIIISKGGKDAQKVKESGVADEDFLQQYIAANPDSLPLETVKADIRLLVVAREFSTRSGPIDVLAIDSDGELYVVETKLYKNPDKRRVVAQMLDYGASLWVGYREPDAFVAEIDARMVKTTGKGLDQRLKEMFELGDEEILLVRDALKRNLIDGNIRFVVLMDRLDEYLKDLILFINQKSRFDIYAVEMAFYRHSGLEIVIPRLFGAEVKKEVAPAVGGGARKKWNEADFFTELENRLSAEQVRTIRRLYDFSRKRANEISWGTGVRQGSFSPKFTDYSERSFYSVYTDGTLDLNFRFMHRTPTEVQMRDEFKRELTNSDFCAIPNDYEDRFVSIPAEVWIPKADMFMRIVADVFRVAQE